MVVTFQIFELFHKSNRALFPCLQSLILTLGGLGEFSQPSSCLDEAICKHGKSALLLKQNIFGNLTNSAKKRLVTSRKIEPNFSNIFGNLTISASLAPSVAFEWYTMEYPTRHLYFLSIHTSLRRLCLYRKKFKCLVGYNYSIRGLTVPPFCYFPVPKFVYYPRHL